MDIEIDGGNRAVIATAADVHLIDVQCLALGLRTHRIDSALPSCTNLLIDAPAVRTAHRSVADWGVVRSLAAGLWGWELPSKKSPFFALTVYPVSGTLTTLFH